MPGPGVVLHMVKYIFIRIESVCSRANPELRRGHLKQGSGKSTDSEGSFADRMFLLGRTAVSQVG